MNYKLVTQLENEGYAELEVQSVAELIVSTNFLGPLISEKHEIETLEPRLKENVTSRSFSYHYGVGSFPLHTDTSFWILPARYIFFYSREKFDTSTTILSSIDTLTIFQDFYKENPIFASKKINGGVYETPWFGPDNKYVKFDPCYMHAANSAANALAKALQERAHERIREITWSGNKALIVDNWRTLHGRSELKNVEARVLTRFYRGNNNDLGKK